MDDDFIWKVAIIIFVVIGFLAVIAVAYGYHDPVDMIFR